MLLSFTACEALSLYTIPHIIVVRAKPKMVRVNARPGVAIVENHQPPRVAFEHFIRKSVRRTHAMAYPHCAISKSVCAAHPQPATAIRFRHGKRPYSLPDVIGFHGGIISYFQPINLRLRFHPVGASLARVAARAVAPTRQPPLSGWPCPRAVWPRCAQSGCRCRRARLAARPRAP